MKIRRTPGRRFTKLLFVLLVLILLSSANAWLVRAEDGGGEEDGMQVYQTLVSKFDQQERLRVIVQLVVPGQVKTAELNTPAIHKAQRDLLSTLSSNNVSLIHQYDYIPFMAVEVDRAGFEGLLKSPLVVGIEEDKINTTFLTESTVIIKAPDLWSLDITGKNQVVAILDTGVEKTHSSLQNKVVSEACFSSNSLVSSSLCPGGVPQSTAVDSGIPCTYTGCDHGTHVAGIVAAQGDVVDGVAKDAKIIAIQVFHLTNTNKLSAFDSDIALGLERVFELRTDFNIASVNLSLGSTETYANECDQYNTLLKASVDKLRNVGIVTIAASGNESSFNGISSPACISTVVSVGATTDFDTVASFSNSAEILDLLAPGSSIYSTIPINTYINKSGTSMAAPHVAGAWALIRSAEPEASVDEIMKALQETGVLILDTRNPSFPTIKPRIDVYNALQSILQPRPTIPSDIQASDGEFVDKVRISWSSTENTTYYQIFRSYRNDSAGVSQIGTIDYPSSIYDDTTADPGVKYYYWVKACNEFYCSDFSISNDGWRGTGTSTPSAPTGVTASDGEYENKVKITWYEVGGANYYQVFRSEINDSNSAKIIIDSLATWSYDDLTAERRKEYYYWVKACKTPASCSAFSISDLGTLKDDFHIYLPILNKNYAVVDPIKNGDFELGRDGSWTEYSSNSYILILEENNLPIYPKSGEWAVWLGDDIEKYGEISRLSQNVLIYSSSPYLHFWYEIFSDDYCSIDYDIFKVKINGSTIFSEELCYANNTIGWTEKVINLSAFSGSSVTLMFEVITDSTVFSSFFLDDVSMSSVSTVSAAVAEEMQVLGDVNGRK